VWDALRTDFSSKTLRSRWHGGHAEQERGGLADGLRTLVAFAGLRIDHDAEREDRAVAGVGGEDPCAAIGEGLELIENGVVVRMAAPFEQIGELQLMTLGDLGEREVGVEVVGEDGSSAGISGDRGIIVQLRGCRAWGRRRPGRCGIRALIAGSVTRIVAGVVHTKATLQRRAPDSRGLARMTTTLRANVVDA
jgi:hypothetical protein